MLDEVTTHICSGHQGNTLTRKLASPPLPTRIMMRTDPSQTSLVGDRELPHTAMHTVPHEGCLQATLAYPDDSIEVQGLQLLLRQQLLKLLDLLLYVLCLYWLWRWLQVAALWQRLLLQLHKLSHALTCRLRQLALKMHSPWGQQNLLTCST